MPRGSFSDRDAERLAKLHAFDAAAGNDVRAEKLALAQEKFADSQSRDARDYAFKQAQEAAKNEAAAAASVQKAQHYQNLNEYKDQRLEQMSAAQKIAEAKAALAAEQQATKDKTTLDVLTQATGFLRDARGMDPTKPEFDRQYQDLLAGYPMAAEHPSVKEWNDYHRPLREKFVAEDIARRKPDLGDKTTVTENGQVKSVTIKQPLKEGEVDAAARQALLTEHDALESAVNAKSGKAQDPAEIAKLNSIKSRLGFQTIGQGATVNAPQPMPAGAAVPPVQAPVVVAAATPSGDFQSPDEYKAAFAAASPGTVLHYKGKAYTKPQVQ